MAEQQWKVDRVIRGGAREVPVLISILITTDSQDVELGQRLGRTLHTTTEAILLALKGVLDAE